MNDNKKSAVIEFRGGMFGLILPFIVLFAGIIMLSVAGKAMPMAFWVPTLARSEEHTSELQSQDTI